MTFIKPSLDDHTYVMFIDLNIENKNTESYVIDYT